MGISANSCKVGGNSWEQLQSWWEQLQSWWEQFQSWWEQLGTVPKLVRTAGIHDHMYFKKKYGTYVNAVVCIATSHFFIFFLFLSLSHSLFLSLIRFRVCRTLTTLADNLMLISVNEPALKNALKWDQHNQGESCHLCKKKFTLFFRRVRFIFFFFPHFLSFFFSPFLHIFSQHTISHQKMNF